MERPIKTTDRDLVYGGGDSTSTGSPNEAFLHEHAVFESATRKRTTTTGKKRRAAASEKKKGSKKLEREDESVSTSPLSRPLLPLWHRTVLITCVLRDISSLHGQSPPTCYHERVAEAALLRQAEYGGNMITDRTRLDWIAPT